ncbi:thioesterase family protein [Micromonospora soli]|uniref:acyl-CoA thioesterase n=1 Tax=Micromonospora sp. NBRC 110009 TaxID=3061627 RepID=UPI00267317C7|nr:thioesterase family protein [Micromonospora sp. NBRC 110009]WKT97395.1 thioesterase family protein [Micromonospora sp. NBRC 110009]
MADPFRVRVTVRGYELDTQGHLNQAVYLQYSEHARWECLRAAGISQDRLIASGVGPVALEVTVKFLRELRGGDEVDVSCEFRWGEGKTFQIVQELTRPDGGQVATVTGVGGLLDLSARRLVPNPRERFQELATDPGPLNL